MADQQFASVVDDAIPSLNLQPGQSQISILLDIRRELRILNDILLKQGLNVPDDLNLIRRDPSYR